MHVILQLFSMLHTEKTLGLERSKYLQCLVCRSDADSNQGSNAAR